MPLSHELTCRHCGSPFVSGRKDKAYCTPNCASKAYHQRRKQDGRAAQMVTARRAIYICLHCRIEFIGSSAHTRYCSNACQAAREHGPGRRPKRPRPRLHLTERQRQAHAKLRRAVRGTTGGKVRWVQGACWRCGAQFLAASGSGTAAYCSAKCKSRDKASRRRARKAGVEIGPGARYAVFERDGWICQICGDPVNRAAVVPALDAPTIDHSTALARLGAHHPDNWQTAHFYCNSVKGARNIRLAGLLANPAATCGKSGT